MLAAVERTTEPLLDAALAAARSGCHILPLHNIAANGQCTCRDKDCSSPGKHPRTKNGLNDATDNSDQIEKWWKRWPKANVGMRTGAISGVFVIDVDCADGAVGETSLEELAEQHGPWPTTLTGITGRDGTHLVYRHPRRGLVLRNTTSFLAPNIDTRGDGGYIVIPPSFTEQRYEWLNQGITLADTPDWVVELLTAPEQPAAPAPARVAPTGDVGGITPYARTTLDRRADEVARAPEGQRNHTLNQAAFRMGQLIAGGQIDESTVDVTLTGAAQRAGLGGVEVARTIRSGLTKGALEPQYPDPSRSHLRSVTTQPVPRSEPENESVPGPKSFSAEPTPPDEPPAPPRRDEEPTDDDPEGEINETDLGNARRLIRRHGHELRYAGHMKQWLRWDGRRWAVDDDAYVDRCAHATAQSIVAEIVTLADPEKQKKRFAHAIKSEAARAVENAMRMASTLKGVRVGAHELDADPWALNVLNGTIDLRTGALRAHDPADLITKLAPVVYDVDAADPRWDAYLQSALRDDDLAGWLQRAVGYTLTGDTSEELLFFVHGPARAGKSTFLEAVKATLGDYSRSAEWETFLDRDHGGGARPDIARLAGARLVTSNEVDEGRKLAEGLVKTLTGGDTITARFLYRDEFEYLPQFKLWLAANHKPKVRHGDDAIWRRIRLVPFLHPPEHVDLELKHHLVNTPAARSAILAWAVRGCTSWQADGLAAVDAVRNATESYRNEMDPLGEFLGDHCAFGTDDEYWVTAKELRKSYEEWATEQGLKRTLSPNAFREALEERGCRSDRRRIDRKAARVWVGLRMLWDDEAPAALPGMSEPDTFENEKRDARDERDGSSRKVPNARAQEEELSEQASRVSRASRADATSATTETANLPGITPCKRCGDPAASNNTLCGRCRADDMRI